MDITCNEYELARERVEALTPADAVALAEKVRRVARQHMLMANFAEGMPAQRAAGHWLMDAKDGVQDGTVDSTVRYRCLKSIQESIQSSPDRAAMMAALF